MQQNSKNSFEQQSQTRILIEEEDNLEAQNTNTNSKFSRKKKIICISVSVSIFLILFFGGLFLILDLLKFQDKIAFNNKNAEIHFHQQDHMGLRLYGSAPKDSSFLRIKKLVCELKNKDGQEMGGLTLDFENQINEGQSKEDPNRSFDLFGKFQPDYRKFENLRNFIAHLMIDSSQTLKISCDTAVSAEIYGFIPITIPHSMEFEQEIKIDEQLGKSILNQFDTRKFNNSEQRKNPIKQLNFNLIKLLFSIDNKEMKESLKKEFDSFIIKLPEIYYDLQGQYESRERRLEFVIGEQEHNLVAQDELNFNFSMECLINGDKACSMMSPFTEMQEQIVKLHQQGKPLNFRMKSKNSNFLSKVMSEDHLGSISKQRQYNTALGRYVNCTVIDTNTGIKGNTCNAFSLDKLLVSMNIEFQAKPIILAQIAQSWNNENAQFYLTNGINLKILNKYNVLSNITFNEFTQKFFGNVSFYQSNNNIYDFNETIQGNYDFSNDRVLFNLTGSFRDQQESFDAINNFETNFRALLDVWQNEQTFNFQTGFNFTDSDENHLQVKGIWNSEESFITVNGTVDFFITNLTKINEIIDSQGNFYFGISSPNTGTNEYLVELIVNDEVKQNNQTDKYFIHDKMQINYTGSSQSVEVYVNLNQKLIWSDQFEVNTLGQLNFDFSNLIRGEPTSPEPTPQTSSNNLNLNVQFQNYDQNQILQSQGVTKLHFEFYFDSVNVQPSLQLNINSYASQQKGRNWYDFETKLRFSQPNENFMLYIQEQISHFELGLDVDWTYLGGFGTEFEGVLTSYMNLRQQQLYSLLTNFQINTIIQVLSLNIQEKVSQTLFQEQFNWDQIEPTENIYYSVYKYESRSLLQSGSQLYFKLYQNLVIDQLKQSFDYKVNEQVSLTINSLFIQWDTTKEDKISVFVHEQLDYQGQLQFNGTLDFNLSMDEQNDNFTVVQLIARETVYDVLSTLQADFKFNFQSQFSTLEGNLTSMTSQYSNKFYDLESAYDLFQDNFHGDETLNVQLAFKEKVSNLIADCTVYLLTRSQKGQYRFNLTSASSYQDKEVYDGKFYFDVLENSYIVYKFSEKVYLIVNNGSANYTHNVLADKDEFVVVIKDYLNYNNTDQFNVTVNFDLLENNTIGSVEFQIQENINSFKTKGNTSWNFQNSINQGGQIFYELKNQGDNLIDLHLISFYNLPQQNFYILVNETVNQMQGRGLMNWQNNDGFLLGVSAITNQDGTVYFNSTIDFNLVDSQNKLQLNLYDGDNIGKNVKCVGLDDKNCQIERRFDGQIHSIWQKSSNSSEVNLVHFTIQSVIADVISIDLKGQFDDPEPNLSESEESKSQILLILETKDPQGNTNLFTNTTSTWKQSDENHFLNVNLNSLMGDNQQESNQYYNVQAKFDLNTTCQNIKLDLSEIVNQVKTGYVANYNTANDGFKLDVLGNLLQNQSSIFDANLTFDFNPNQNYLKVHFYDKDPNSTSTDHSVIKAHTETSWNGDYHSEENPFTIIEDLDIQYQSNDILKVFFNAEFTEQQRNLRQLSVF